jgi:hypothetical protein
MQENRSMAAPAHDKLAEIDMEERRRRADELMAAIDAFAAEVAKLSPEDQERFELELNEAVDSAIRRRVEYLDRMAAEDPESWTAER